MSAIQEMTRNMRQFSAFQAKKTDALSVFRAIIDKSVKPHGQEVVMNS
jgi:predicted transcriptional regulator